MDLSNKTVYPGEKPAVARIQEPVIIFSPEALGFLAYCREVIKFRALVWVFAKQELKIMYVQTYFGILWSVIRPLFTLFVFTIIFRFFLHVPTRTPYYLFAFTGMIAWNFFSQIALNGSVAIIQKQALIHKMYFPKLVLLISKIVTAGVESGISLLILFVLIFASGLKLTVDLFALPLFIFLNILCGFVIAIWMNTLNIRFRDLNQIVPAIIGIAIWVTPVFYPTSIIPSGYEFFLYVNPMAGVIKGYRFALLGESFPVWQYWISIVVTLSLAFFGLFYFSKVEDRIVDHA